MKRNLIIAALVLGMAGACKNESKPEETKQETAQETSNTGAEEAKPEEAPNPMKEFAGTWKQEVKGEIPNLTDVKQLAAIEVTLNEDGTFDGSQKVMNNSVTMKGTWKVDGDMVELNWNGEILHLKADASKKTLTDSKEGVVLEKQ